MGLYEKSLESATACQSPQNGIYQLLAYRSAGYRDVRPFRIDMGKRLPADLSEQELLIHSLRFMRQPDRQRVVALTISRLCLRAEHTEPAARTDIDHNPVQLERVGSFILSNGQPPLPIEPLARALPPHDGGIGAIRERTGGRTLAPAVFLPVTPAEHRQIPITEAYEVSAADGTTSAFVVPRGPVHIVNLQDLR